jgi:hypothetical protein
MAATPKAARTEKKRAAAAARVAEVPAETAGEHDEETEPTGSAERRTSGPSRNAAERATGEGIRLPVIGRLPISRDQAGFYAGLGALAAVGLIDWPVAAAVGAGHWLVRRSQSGTLRAFGEALDEA